MAPGTPERREVKHYAHKHPLAEVNGIRMFTCDGCNMYGSGKSYRCGDCDFDLHEFCAMCPSSLRTSVHPPHELCRVDKPTRQNQRVCDVCNVDVKGLFYRCESCDFDVHPLCILHPPPHATAAMAASQGTRQRSLVTPEGQPSSPYYSAPGSPFGYGPHHPGGGYYYVNPSPGPDPDAGQGKDQVQSPRTSKGKRVLKMAAGFATSVFTNVVAGAVAGELMGTSEESQQ